MTPDPNDGNHGGNTHAPRGDGNYITAVPNMQTNIHQQPSKMNAEGESAGLDPSGLLAASPAMNERHDDPIARLQKLVPTLGSSAGIQGTQTVHGSSSQTSQRPSQRPSQRRHHHHHQQQLSTSTSTSPTATATATNEADSDKIDTIVMMKSGVVPLNTNRNGRNRDAATKQRQGASIKRGNGAKNDATTTGTPTGTTTATATLTATATATATDIATALKNPTIPRASTSTSTSVPVATAVISRASSKLKPTSASVPGHTRPGHTDAGARAPSTPIAPSTTLHPPTSSSNPKAKSTLRRGKWTAEEEAYVARIIQDFNSGFLNAPAGTTLRSYLSEKLQCDPMRITKKFTGDACIGKRVFHPAVRSSSNASAIDKAQTELDGLERRWRRRLEVQQRESAKKAAASAAAHASTLGRASVLLPKGPLHTNAESVGNQTKQQVVTQTASWLDRANALLKAEVGAAASKSSPGTSSHSKDATVPNPNAAAASAEIENQMKEVQRLIYEGPYIQQTSAGLPQLLDQSHDRQREHTSTPTGAARTISARSSNSASPPDSPSSEHLDKRMRPSSQQPGAEDAEALVGFLRSVRASAASGQTL